jgi:serine/threonine protein kinase
MATCPDCLKHLEDGTETCPDDGATLVPDAVMAEHAKNEIAPGAMVGEYRIEAKIGEGGFGSVYRAVHPLIGKPVAIKLLSRAYSDNPQIVSRFISEARAVNQIRHKNIVDIFSFGALADGRQYFVMELLQGSPLDGSLEQRGHLEVGELMPVLRGVLKALIAAHTAGLVHRDLKPENVFLCVDDEGVVTPKLIDFGIAKLLGDESVEHKTRTGTPMGTPYYMSPEQCRGKNVDHRTDLYAIGAMIHVLLTGQKPFTGDSAMDLLYKQMAEAPPKLSDHRQGLPQALEDIVLRLLAKKPEDRPQTAAETLALLEAAIGSERGELSLSAGRNSSHVAGIGAAKTELVSQLAPAAPAATNASLSSVEVERSPTPSRSTSPLLLIGVGAGAVVAIAAAAFFVGGAGKSSVGSESAAPGAATAQSATAQSTPSPTAEKSVVVTPAVTNSASASTSAAVDRPSPTPLVTASPTARPTAVVTQAPTSPDPAATAKPTTPKPVATFNPNEVIFE